MHWHRLVRRYASTNAKVSTIRNVGVIAHVDAGKTTTTERMLFYAGAVGHIGNVDDGDTTTDYLRQERERGITITSAAVSFDWEGSQFNLIDTPGHVDFTYEVERALRAMDGSVTIVDGVSGVQAQTLTVWRQALRHGVAQIIYVNKLDRDGASMERACRSVRERLGVRPLVLQMPANEDCDSIVDLVTMELLEWHGQDGERVARQSLVSVRDSEIILERAILARERLLEELAECDDEFADVYLEAMADAEDEMSTSVSSSEIWRALLRVTHDSSKRKEIQGCVVMCGASLRNVGVQPLMDVMAKLLPSPADVPRVVAYDDKNVQTTRGPLNSDLLCALAFKVIHTQDKQRRPLVLTRVYSGTIEAGMMIHNTDTGKKERVQRILQISAGHGEDTDSVSEGNVAALIGLSGTRTGDTLCEVATKKKKKKSDGGGAVRLEGMVAPPPVFTSAIETYSSSEDDALREALNQLCLEDPSIHLISDGNDQSNKNSTLARGDSRVVVGGMGELHLDLLLDRLQREYNLPDITMGQLRVAYRETIDMASIREYEYEQRMGDRTLGATVRVLVEPVVTKESGEEKDVENETSFNSADGDDGGNGGEFEECALKGARDALYSGPIAGYPVTNTRVEIQHIEPHTACNPAIVRASVAMGTTAAMLDAEPVLLEPVMRLELEMPESKMGAVMSDLNAHRRASIRHFDASKESEDGVVFKMASIDANVPLVELLGYSTKLRSLTAGEASYSISFDSYQPVTDRSMIRKVVEGSY